MPLLTEFAGIGLSNYGFSRGGGGAAGSYELIETAYGTGSSATITFSSIPNTYKHLQVRFVAKKTTSGATGLFVRLNGDTASNYSEHHLAANGSSVFSGANLGEWLFYNEAKIVGSDAGGGATGVMDLVNYANTATFKTAKLLNGFADTGGNVIRLVSGSWRNTSAISSITFDAQSGNFTTSTRFSLYGIKG